MLRELILRAVPGAVAETGDIDVAPVGGDAVAVVYAVRRTRCAVEGVPQV